MLKYTLNSFFDTIPIPYHLWVLYTYASFFSHLCVYDMTQPFQALPSYCRFRTYRRSILIESHCATISEFSNIIGDGSYLK